MKDCINVQCQRGSLTNYLYGYCLLSTLLFILLFFDIIVYKDSNNIYKGFSEKNYTDIIQDVEFAVTESNFRIVNRINIGEAIQERKNSAFPKNEVVLFCNLTIAEEMLKLEPDFINFCPYKITITERLEDSDFNKKIMVSTRLLPTDTESKNINNFSANINKILRKMVEYAVSEDPFLIDLKL